MKFNRKSLLAAPAVLLMLLSSGAPAVSAKSTLSPGVPRIPNAKQLLMSILNEMDQDSKRSTSTHKILKAVKAVKPLKRNMSKRVARKAIKQSRRISFAKARAPFRYQAINKNARDLGGYVGANGRYVKPGRLIRSGSLYGMNRKGKASINKLHVTRVIDLRNAKGRSSIATHPDPNETRSNILPGTRARYVHAPVYTSQEVPKLHRQEHKHGGMMYYYGAPAVSNPNAIKAYQKVFKTALQNKHGAVLLHCDLGRDRTGTASALLLSALGVKNKDIYRDYLLTNRYLTKNNPKRQKRMTKQLNEFFGTISYDYGSVDGYLHDGLKLSNGQIAKLRNMYLQK